MTTGIEFNYCSNVVLDDVRVEGFDKGISFHGCEDILIRNTHVIDSIMKKLSLDGGEILLQKFPISLKIDVTELKKLSQDVLTTENQKERGQKAKQVLITF